MAAGILGHTASTATASRRLARIAAELVDRTNCTVAAAVGIAEAADHIVKVGHTTAAGSLAAGTAAAADQVAGTAEAANLAAGTADQVAGTAEAADQVAGTATAADQVAGTAEAADIGLFVAFAGQAVNSVVEAVALAIRIVRADSSVAAGEALALGLGLVR